MRRSAVRVHPAMIPATHPLASVRDAFNAVFVEGTEGRQLMFYGRGAGGDPTATAVVGDLVTVARDLRAAPGASVARAHSIGASVRWTTLGGSTTYLRVEDRPGVLAEIAAVFGRNGVSIERVWQEGSGDEAQLVFVTHRAREARSSRRPASCAICPRCRAVPSVLRVEGEE